MTSVTSPRIAPRDAPDSGTISRNMEVSAPPLGVALAATRPGVWGSLGSLPRVWAVVCGGVSAAPGEAEDRTGIPRSAT